MLTCPLQCATTGLLYQLDHQDRASIMRNNIMRSMRTVSFAFALSFCVQHALCALASARAMLCMWARLHLPCQHLCILPSTSIVCTTYRTGLTTTDSVIGDMDHDKAAATLAELFPALAPDVIGDVLAQHADKVDDAISSLLIIASASPPVRT